MKQEYSKRKHDRREAKKFAKKYSEEWIAREKCRKEEKKERKKEVEEEYNKFNPITSYKLIGAVLPNQLSNSEGQTSSGTLPTLEYVEAQHCVPNIPYSAPNNNYAMILHANSSPNLWGPPNYQQQMMPQMLSPRGPPLLSSPSDPYRLPDPPSSSRSRIGSSQRGASQSTIPTLSMSQNIQTNYQQRPTPLSFSSPSCYVNSSGSLYQSISVT